MIRLAKKKRAEVKEGKVVASAAGPGGILTSFNEGIQELSDGTAKALAGELRTETGVAKIEKKEGGYLLHLEDGSQIDAELVVSAAPAYAAANMLDELDRGAAELLRGIPYATMNVVCFGYQQDKIEYDLNGFGYLNAKAEGCNTLGTLWDSSIFPNRAPEGHVLLRSMMGGGTNPGAIDFSEDEVKASTMADLKQIMGIEAEPDFVRIFRHRKAIPQYVVGHGQRLQELDGKMAQHPGLFLTGNAFGGVGLNDCVNSSNLVAEKVIELLKARQAAGDPSSGR
jgi:oxygen-dependent protoporphyrinogen oxidase